MAAPVEVALADAAGTAAKVEGTDAHRGEGLALRALFVYLRNADGVRELQGRELLLWLPPRAGSLLLNGKRVEPEAEAVLHLRRERSGSFVSMDAIAFSGVLPFMLGRASERWLLGSLHSAAVYGEGEGASGWSLELSGTALGSCAVSRDVRVDVEVLAVGIAVGGRPCCMSAHAPLPTRRARPASHSRPARGLESIAENEKVELPLVRCAAAGDPQELDDSPLSGLEAETQAEPGGVVGEWDPGASLESVALFKDRYNCNALIGEADDPEHRLNLPELTWFGAGLRVGVGVGLGVCLGLGLGAGILINTYRRTTVKVANLRNAGMMALRLA